jgi:hypothetical protein
MLPYDGITRTGSKGVSHCADYSRCEMPAKTPSEAGKVKERRGKSKPNTVSLSHRGGLAILPR